jgi:hypothetical protein
MFHVEHGSAEADRPIGGRLRSAVCAACLGAWGRRSTFAAGGSIGLSFVAIWGRFECRRFKAGEQDALPPCAVSRETSGVMGCGEAKPIRCQGDRLPKTKASICLFHVKQRL